MLTSSELGHIPGTSRLALVTTTVEFMRDAEGWAARQTDRHGSNFRIHTISGTQVIFGTPEAARRVLLDPDGIYSARRGWYWPIGKLFEGGLLLRDFDDHRSHRQAMQFAFRTAAMERYASMMNDVIDRHIGRWASQTELSFYRSVKSLTLEIAARVFMGEAPGGEADAVNRSLINAVKASISPIRREVPGSAYRRGMNGRRYMQSYFGSRIAERRANPGEDLFSQLCIAEDPTMSDTDIVNHMIFLLMAAHDTTTASLATMAWYFSKDQTWQNQLREEIHDVGNDTLEWSSRKDYPLAAAVFREAIRLHPPVPFIPRGTNADSEIDGIHIPANTFITVAPLQVHRHPDYWKKPDEFDPERFLRDEHRGHSHMYLPFSGGAHTCIGMGFAELMTTAITTQALSRLRFATTPGQTERILTVPIPKPKNGLPLQVERL